MLKRRTASAGFFPQIWDNRLDLLESKASSMNKLSYNMAITAIKSINLPPTESSGYEFGVNACLQKLKFSHLTQNHLNPLHPTP